jgi:hypothetical protein
LGGVGGWLLLLKAKKRESNAKGGAAQRSFISRAAGRSTLAVPTLGGRKILKPKCLEQ